MMPALSIVTVSYNAQADLATCLESLASSPPAIPYEIIVVDNASTDNSVGVARERQGVRLIEAGGNLGFARATNLGIRASSGQYLLLLNSDTVVPPGAIDRLIAFMDSRPEIAVVGPRLVDVQGRPELSFGRMLGPWTELRRKFTSSEGIARVTAIEQQTDWVTAACLLVRRTTAEAVGLLDERYFMYEEDVDFCAAIRHQGGRILFTPAVEVVHKRGASAVSAPSATRAAYHRSHLAFYEKHRPGWAWALRLWQKLRGVAP